MWLSPLSFRAPQVRRWIKSPMVSVDKHQSPSLKYSGPSGLHLPPADPDFEPALCQSCLGDHAFQRGLIPPEESCSWDIQPGCEVSSPSCRGPVLLKRLKTFSLDLLQRCHLKKKMYIHNASEGGIRMVAFVRQFSFSLSFLSSFPPSFSWIKFPVCNPGWSGTCWPQIYKFFFLCLLSARVAGLRHIPAVCSPLPCTLTYCVCAHAHVWLCVFVHMDVCGRMQRHRDTHVEVRGTFHPLLPLWGKIEFRSLRLTGRNFTHRAISPAPGWVIEQ